MTLSAIVLLILLGILFLLLEILIIPGVGFVGIIGAGLMAIGVFFAYNISSLVGHCVLASTIILSIGMLWLSLRSKTWNRISLKESITGKVNTIDDDVIHTGDEGVSISRLAPMGKAKINGLYIEVQSTGDFINENTQIVVTKINGNKILVKAKQ